MSKLETSANYASEFLSNHQETLKEKGFNNRHDYLVSLSEDYGVDLDTVLMLADVLGESEDFDGLINSLEDASELSDYE